MKTQTVTIRRFTPSDSTGNSYTAKVTMPAPPFALPTDRDLALLDRQAKAAAQQEQAG